MTDRPDIEDVLGRVRRFEEKLSSIGVSVKVDVRGLDAKGHEYGTHGSGPARCVQPTSGALPKDAGRGPRSSLSALREQSTGFSAVPEAEQR